MDLAVVVEPQPLLGEPHREKRNGVVAVETTAVHEGR